jgi:hypothetical protein
MGTEHLTDEEGLVSASMGQTLLPFTQPTLHYTVLRPVRDMWLTEPTGVRHSPTTPASLSVTPSSRTRKPTAHQS